MTVSVCDIAWLAGLLEGEGCFTITKGSVTVQLSMTDEDIVLRAAALVGAPSVGLNNRYQNTDGRHKSCYRWTLCGTPAASWMMTLYSLMGRRRQARIRELLTIWKGTHPYRRPITECPHIDRPHQGRGMCKSCYQLDWYHRVKKMRRRGGDACERAA